MGRPGDNQGYDWPLQEHAILVDNKGFVWLSGNGKGDSMVLKFTPTEVRQRIGKRGPLTSSVDLSQFGMVAALELDAKANEIDVADGYGNHRVAVLDADTGEISACGAPTASRRPTTNPAHNPNSPRSPNPVHCIALAKDGLVDVAPHQEPRPGLHKNGGFV